MTERMKTFIYCAITAVVTTIVVSAGQPQAVQAQATGGLGKSQTITHIIQFGGLGVVAGANDPLRTLIIKQK